MQTPDVVEQVFSNNRVVPIDADRGGGIPGQSNLADHDFSLNGAQDMQNVQTEITGTDAIDTSGLLYLTIVINALVPKELEIINAAEKAFMVTKEGIPEPEVSGNLESSGMMPGNEEWAVVMQSFEKRRKFLYSCREEAQKRVVKIVGNGKMYKMSNFDHVADIKANNAFDPFLGNFDNR